MITEALHQICAGRHLTCEQATAVMEELLSGRATDAHIAGLLVALRMKGETVDELVGFARVMRERARPLPLATPADEALVDTCGTGGDGCGTFNVSTVAALVAAGAGVRVAKHGNRAISSHCGSADVLEALGVNILCPVERMAAAISEIGIGFLFAPALHTAMKHVQKPRRDLKIRTVFNLLGPLANPAGATAQVVGVYDQKLTEPLAQALGELGVRRAYVVAAEDGMDEISTTSATRIAELWNGSVRTYDVKPEEFGLPRARLDDLRGGDAGVNAEIARAVLGGEKGPRRDIVLINAAAALLAAGKAEDFPAGLALAAESIDSGAARAKLEALIRFSNS